MSLLNSRYFNTVQLDGNGLIVKKSMNEEKLKNEINWYLKLPDPLHHFIPTIDSYSKKIGNVFVKMENVPFPTLSEVLIRGEFSKNEWEQTFCLINDLLESFSFFKGSLSSDSINEMYINKTYNRLSSFINSSEWAKKINKKGYFTFNGTKLECPLRMIQRYKVDIKTIVSKPKINLLHGDLCFSNILVDIKSKKIKIIDPRGSFGDTGIYGDQYYDLAKIRHSVSGYDFIISENYNLTYSEHEVDLDIFSSPLQQWLGQYWDSLIGNQVHVIKVIEALLFLSMLPLHQDSEHRQIAFYGFGSYLLNKALT